MFVISWSVCPSQAFPAYFMFMDEVQRIVSLGAPLRQALSLLVKVGKDGQGKIL
jgi:hypothetical protein